MTSEVMEFGGHDGDLEDRWSCGAMMRVVVAAHGHIGSRLKPEEQKVEHSCCVPLVSSPTPPTTISFPKNISKSVTLSRTTTLQKEAQISEHTE